ncbi:hypothetical protein ANRL4_02674 [Anaerolineae bacterium]|nr:hypothetical protein ANRL4_02674 [Anaerolineae bacterium]
MSNFDPEAIRAKIEKRHKKRQEFYVHVGIYIAVHLLLWFIWFSTTPTGFPWPLIIMFAWGIGIVADALETYFETNEKLASQREAAIEREIERERARLGAVEFEKPKRRAHLSDDGELVYEDESSETSEEEDSRQTRRR